MNETSDVIPETAEIDVKLPKFDIRLIMMVCGITVCALAVYYMVKADRRSRELDKAWDDWKDRVNKMTPESFSHNGSNLGFKPVQVAEQEKTSE